MAKLNTMAKVASSEPEENDLFSRRSNVRTVCGFDR